MLQGRVQDPTGTNTNGIWVAPMRDIAHCGPYMISAALRAMDEQVFDGETADKDKAAMEQYVKCLLKFIKLSNGETRITGDDGHIKAFKQSGLLDQPDKMHKLFGKWLTRVFLSTMFKGISEALHGTEAPLGVKELTTKAKELYEFSD